MRDADPHLLTAVAEKTESIQDMCELCSCHTELLETKEVLTISDIQHSIRCIEQALEMELEIDESVHSYAEELRSFLHDCFDDCGGDPERLRRFHTYLGRFDAESIDALCSGLHSYDDIHNARDILEEVFSDYEWPEEEGDGEERDYYPYPEQVYPEEYEKLKTNVYESKWVTHFNILRREFPHLYRWRDESPFCFFSKS